MTTVQAAAIYESGTGFTLIGRSESTERTKRYFIVFQIGAEYFCRVFEADGTSLDGTEDHGTADITDITHLDYIDRLCQYFKIKFTFEA